MNITLISKQKDFSKAIPVGGFLTEYYRDPFRKDLIYLQLYDPADNSYYEIAPDIKKTDHIDIINCIWESASVYFASYEITDKGNVNISVYRHDVISGESMPVCSFLKKMDILNDDHKLKLFILNDNTMLMQTEILQKKIEMNLMGNIEFQIDLYNLEAGTHTPVSEANLINNGINCIIPLSDKRILVKTGYSFLEDSRLDSGNETESFIEGVYITTSAKFIADIALSTDVLDMPLIESAYLDKHILKPSLDGDYIHYCVADVPKKNTVCIFYNIKTEERIEYSTGSFDQDDMYVTHIVNNTPYVRNKNDSTVDFLNLRKVEIDISFFDSEFIAQKDKVFVLESRSRKSHMHVYSLPYLKRVVDEDREFECMVKIGKTYYIYC